jgi:hypothetical protein
MIERPCGSIGRSQYKPDVFGEAQTWYPSLTILPARLCWRMSTPRFGPPPSFITGKLIVPNLWPTIRILKCGMSTILHKKSSASIFASFIATRGSRKNSMCSAPNRFPIRASRRAEIWFSPTYPNHSLPALWPFSCTGGGWLPPTRSTTGRSTTTENDPRILSTHPGSARSVGALRSPSVGRAYSFSPS